MGNVASAEPERCEYPYGVYEGDVVTDLFGLGGTRRRHGKGRMSWNDGAQYVGAWEMDEMQGEGKLTFPNGNEFQGSFYKNNPHGEGALTTSNKERIYGIWNCVGRSDVIDSAHSAPVAKYMLNVTVLDESTNRAQAYHGPGTLHLSTGMVVLPGMSHPNDPIFEYAAIYKHEEGEGAAAHRNAPVATPVALEPHAQGFVPISGAAQAAPVLESSSAGGVHVAQAIPESQSTQPQQQPAVAYGFHDPALEPRDRQASARPQYHFLDPRNYF